VTLTGASGRQPKINPGWKNPSGVWRVGAKWAFELLPGSLTNRAKVRLLCMCV
jgi:tripeptidyl-peptidase-2